LPALAGCAVLGSGAAVAADNGAALGTPPAQPTAPQIGTHRTHFGMRRSPQI
jgi:hypothetical protein